MRLFILTTASLLLFAATLTACGPPALDPPKLPTAAALSAEQPSIETMLWWLPQDTETIVFAQGPFEIPTLDARPPASLDHVLRAVTLTLLRNIQGGRFQAFLSEQGRLVQIAFSARRPSPDAQRTDEELAVLILDAPLSEQEWKVFTEAASDVRVIQGAQTAKLEQSIRQAPQSLWVAWPTPNIVLIANAESLLDETLQRRRNPSAPRALAPTNRAWKSFSTGDPLWALRVFAGEPPSFCSVRASNNSVPGMIYACFDLSAAERARRAERWLKQTRDGVLLVEGSDERLELHATLGEAPHTSLVILELLRALGYTVPTHPPAAPTD